nr:restriction endonuclease subunit S [uncultured Capnocytophaga sp.]
MKTYKKLKLVELKEFDLWDIKRYTSKKLKSTFNIEKLSNCIKEENRKYKLYLEEDKTFGILGVNNKDGIFDAYEQKGKEINQPYKKMEIGWLAYNPYRINVGSIGIRKKEHLYQYISPAYVVFSCLDNLLSEYLYLLFRTERFIKIINESTTGSVRQNLTSEILKTLEIPLPSISEQETIVKNYCDKITQATTYEQQAETLEKKIESYLFEELGVSFQKYEVLQIGKLHFIEFKEMENWIYNSIEMQFYKDLSKSKFPINTIGDVFDFISRNWEKEANEDKEYIELGSIDANFGILETKTINPKKAPSRATQIVKTGDLIIGTTRPYLKKFAIIDENHSDFVASSGFSVIEENKGKYNLYFLNEVIKSDIGIKQFEIKMTGALYPAITQKELESLKIPVPPLSKQNEIAATIATMKQDQKNKIERATLLKQQAKQEFEQTIFS